MHLSSGEGGRVPTQRRTGWSEADSLCLSKQLLTLRTYLRMCVPSMLLLMAVLYPYVVCRLVRFVVYVIMLGANTLPGTSYGLEPQPLRAARAPKSTPLYGGT